MVLRPTEKEIWATVDRITASEPFRQSERLQAFLRYIVKETLEDRSDRIKSYSISLEVFNRETGDDAIVRTTAVRLREAIEKYYINYKNSDDIVIALPKGRYIPFFSYSENSGGVQEAIPAIEPSDRIEKKRWLSSGVIGAAVIICIAIGFYSFAKLQSNKGHSSIYLLISKSEITNDVSPSIATEFTRELIGRLVGIGTAKIIELSDTDLANQTIASQVDSIQSGVMLVLSTYLRRDAEGLKVIWRLSDARSNIVLWVAEKGTQNASVQDIAMLASATAASVIGVEGAVSILMSRFDQSSDDKLTCIPRSHRLSIIFDELYQSNIIECLEAAALDQPNKALLWGLLAQLYIYTGELKASQGQDIAPWIKKFEVAARHAERLSPHTFFSQQAKLFSAFYTNKVEDFKDIAAVMLKQYSGDPHLKMRIASRLIRLDEYSEGRRLIQDAIRSRETVKPWDYVSLSLAYYGEGAYDEALVAADKAEATESYLVPMFKAASLAALDRLEEAQLEINKLLLKRPNYSENIFKDAVGRGASQAFTDRVIKDLVKAGLKFPDQST